MRALVTGGAGFIGSNVVDGLVAAGHDVVVVDNLTTGRLANLEDAFAAGASLARVDVRDAEQVLAVCVDHQPDVIFHLAAQIDVRRSVSDPDWDGEVNVLGTINVLEAARETRVPRIVYSSTGGALYGEAERVPSPETTPIAPISPYGMSKHCAEGYMGLYRRLHGISTLTLRYANVYGPRQDPLGEGGVVAIFCGRLADGGRPTVYGDGRQTRDFVHVDDVVRANLLAADSEVVGALNIGRGEETSVLDLIDACAPLAADGFDPVFEPARPGEVTRSALDATEAFVRLGWRAEIGVEEGLARTLDWARTARATRPPSHTPA